MIGRNPATWMLTVTATAAFETSDDDDDDDEEEEDALLVVADVAADEDDDEGLFINSPMLPPSIWPVSTLYHDFSCWSFPAAALVARPVACLCSCSTRNSVAKSDSIGSIAPEVPAKEVEPETDEPPVPPATPAESVSASGGGTGRDK